MSRIIDILTAIKNNTAYSTETYSRIEAILKSIANNTSYTAAERSRHEELLLAIKNGYGVGHQLFDRSKAIENYALVWRDGGLFEVPFSVASSFIPIENGVMYSTNYNAQVIFYNSNKEFIEVFTSMTAFRQFSTNNTDVKYVRLAYRPVDNATDTMLDKNIMLNEGTTALQYEPFSEIKEPQTRIEEILFAIANDTLEEYLEGKNLLNMHDESKIYASYVNYNLNDRSVFVETKANTSSVPRRLVMQFGCKKNTNYNCSLKLKLDNILDNQTSIMIRKGQIGGDVVKTVSLLETTDIQNVNFTFNSGDNEVLYLWLYLAMSSTLEYQSVTYSDIKLEIGTNKTPYIYYAFLSELEEAYYEAADNLAGQNVYQNGDTVYVVKANSTQSGNEVVL